MRLPRLGIAASRSAREAVLILTFAFGALLVAAGVGTGLRAELGFVLVVVVEGLSPPELQAVRTKMSGSAKDKGANPEIIFRENIGFSYRSVLTCGGGGEKYSRSWLAWRSQPGFALRAHCRQDACAPSLAVPA